MVVLLQQVKERKKIMGENGNWDIKEVKRRQDSYVDPAPVGCGRYYTNTKRDYEKLKKSVLDNVSAYTDPDDAYRAIRCLYATARAISGQSDSISDAIRLNKACGYTIDMEKFFEMVDNFEKKTPARAFRTYIRHGEYYSRKRFIKCCKIDDPQAYGYGFRYVQEERKDKKRRMKERLWELMYVEGITVPEMVKQLKLEGFSVSDRSIKRYIADQGIRWSEFKKGNRKLEIEEGIELE